MKKNLLLVAALCATVCASAQGTWKAGEYLTTNGIAADAVALTSNQEITSVPNIVFTAGGGIDSPDGDWLAKPSSTGETFTFNSVDYSQDYVQGQKNGATVGDPKCPSLNYSGGTLNAARAEFAPSIDGTLDVTFKAGYNKQFWVIETTQDYLDGDIFTGDFTTAEAYNGGQYWGGYFWSDGANAGQYYVPTVAGVADETAQGPVAYTGVTLNVTAGKKYIVLVTGSKLMLCGFNFVAGTAAISSVEAVEVASEKYYTVSGMEVAAPVKGINIVKQTMVDGTVKTVKVIK